MFARQFARKFCSAPMTTMQCSPFTKVVVEAVRKLYPEKLADSSFDNTGLLLEAPHRQDHNDMSVLLTIDLTKGVAEEAIQKRCAVIVAYHPIIFRPLKALTLANVQQSTLLRLAQEGISVYCPHTAVDAAPNGLNDFLADIVAGKTSIFNKDGKDYTPSAHTRKVITPIENAPSGFEKAGYGRIVTFSSPQKLGALVSRISAGLGSLSGLSIAVPQSVPQGSKSEIDISSVGICAGSGGSMLNGLDVDLLFTGELSHHEALAAVGQGKVVVTAFHSNTERAFLSQRMLGLLGREIREGLAAEKGGELEGEEVNIMVSKVDRDPYEMIVAGQTGW